MSAAAKSTNAGTLLAPDALAMLRVLGAQGKVTLAVLRTLDPNPGKPGKASPTMARVNVLRASRLVKLYKPTPRASIVAEITDAGRQALRGVGPAPVALVKGAPAAPTPAPVVPAPIVRRATPAPRYETYNGAELTRTPPRGVEALRAFTLPSLVNGERIERVRPSIMGSSKPDRLQDGRGGS